MKLLQQVKDAAMVAFGMIIAAVLVVPFTILKLFEKPLTPAELAAFLRDCIKGTADDDEIDSFTSMKISDPQLQQIIDELWTVPDDWTSQDAIQKLEELLARAEAMAATTRS